MWFFTPDINEVQLLWSQQERGTKGTSVWGLQPLPQKVEDHISSKKSHLTYRLLEAGKLMGNCYKMQVFESLYLTFSFSTSAGS